MITIFTGNCEECSGENLTMVGFHASGIERCMSCIEYYVVRWINDNA